MGIIIVAAVLSTMHFEGNVTADGGDYVDVAFDVPVGTVEIQITHSDGSANVILDWGVWGPDGYRGWAGGLTDDAIIGVDQSSRSYLPGPITPGTWTISIGKAKLENGMGHYSIDVVCRDNATLPVLPKAPFTPVVLGSERRWYAGDFHVHSIQSGDATATFDEIRALAKSRGLDFVNLSDHNTFAQHALIAAIQPSEPALLLLRGSEITTYSGHANSVGTNNYVEHRLGYAGRAVAGIVDDVAAQGGVLIVNHPVLDLGSECIGCVWNHVEDTPWGGVSALELITGNFDIGIQVFVPRVITLWDSLLDQDQHIAVVGGSDDHRAGMDMGPTSSQIGSPTTLVLADNLSEAAIVEAVRKGRTIVKLRNPDDPFVDMTIGNAEIGDVLDNVSSVTVKAHVVGGDGTFVQLWRNGVKIEHKAVTGNDTTVTFSDSTDTGAWRYRVELINDINQRLVVTSHIYVNTVGGCGCRSSSGGGWLIALALLFARSGGQRARRAASHTPNSTSAPQIAVRSVGSSSSRNIAPVAASTGCR